MADYAHECNVYYRTENGKTKEIIKEGTILNMETGRH